MTVEDARSYIHFGMATATMITMRLRGEDLELVQVLMDKTGIRSRTDIVRFALRRLAETEGLQIAVPKKTK